MPFTLQTSIPSPKEHTIPVEWQIERLDIDAYLQRIGIDGPLAPTESTLHTLHRAHAETIPFENLDILLGRGISLEMDDIQDKLVRQQRGGYCYEHNLLFSALLEHAGFEVRRLVARVNPDKPGPRSHMMLNVSLGNQTWLADVGFGAALLEPVPLIDGAISRQDAWTTSVKRQANGSWRLRSAGEHGWSDLYEFTMEPQRYTDYVIANHFTATHPSSPFVGQVVAIRITPEARYTLRDRQLSVGRPDGTSDDRAIGDDELGTALWKTFGIELDSAEISLLQEPTSTRRAR